jgi:hypothetical protein
MTKFVSLAVNQDINLRLHFTDYFAHLLMKRTLAAGQSFNEDLTNQKGSLGRNPVIGDRLVTEDLAPLQRAGFERLAQSYNDEIGISRAPVLPISTTQRRRGNASKGARALLR